MRAAHLLLAWWIETTIRQRRRKLHCVCDVFDFAHGPTVWPRRLTDVLQLVKMATTATISANTLTMVVTIDNR